MRDGPGLLYFDFVIDRSTDSTNVKGDLMGRFSCNGCVNGGKVKYAFFALKSNSFGEIFKDEGGLASGVE